MKIKDGVAGNGLSRIGVLGLVSLALIVLSCPGSSGFAATWQKEGMCVSNGDYWNPDVVRLANGQLRMYYEYQPSGNVKNIYSLISSDGLTWESENGIRISEGNMPAVVQLPDGRWRIYYNDCGSFGSAISEDGLNFVKEGGYRLEPSGEGYEAYGIRHPTVVKLDDGTYRMYYDAQEADGRQERILSAVSSDGLTWQKEGVRVDYSSIPNCDSLTSPYVVRTSDGYTRLYLTVRGFMATEKSGIYLAVSQDGLDFSIKEGPEIGGFDEGGQSHGIMDPSVVEIQTGTLRMYYWIGLWYTLPASGVYSATAGLDFGETLEGNGDDGDDDGGNCFVATACYGSNTASEVLSLRRLRDKHLLTNPAGRALVGAYYALSPPCARFITGHPVLMAIVREELRPIVRISDLICQH